MNTSILFRRLSLEYKIRRLAEKDIQDIYELSKENTEYYKYCKTKPSIENSKEILTNLPLDKEIKDKYVIGFYKEGKLKALLDLIVEYPDKDTFFIGLLIISRKCQRKGVGTEIVNEISEFLKRKKYGYIRLGCIKENKKAEKFWMKNGFYTVKEVSQEKYTITVMERKL
ncbi:MAG: GNAT family N-acetyltransferase [Leptotrichiaceae bacterium]|nr:GNAT family N-acetyltransferase [Leptotrichiaceae bacterium]